MLTLILVAVALFVGAAIGMFVMALCVVSTRSERRFQKSIDEYVDRRP